MSRERAASHSRATLHLHHRRPAHTPGPATAAECHVDAVMPPNPAVAGVSLPPGADDGALQAWNGSPWPRGDGGPKQQVGAWAGSSASRGAGHAAWRRRRRWLAGWLDRPWHQDETHRRASRLHMSCRTCWPRRVARHELPLVSAARLLRRARLASTSGRADWPGLMSDLRASKVGLLAAPLALPACCVTSVLTAPSAFKEPWVSCAP